MDSEEKNLPEPEEVTEEKETPEEPKELPKPLFVVKSVLDGEAQLEATNATTGKSAAIMSYIILGICIAMFVTLTVLFFLYKDTGNLVMAVVLLLCIGFVIYNKKVAPKKAVQRWETDLIRIVGEPRLHLVTEFYEHSLVQTVEEQEDNIMDAGYSEIRDMKESEHLFLLKAGGRQWFFLAKDGFTVGDADSFRKFIRQHLEAK